MTRMVLGLFLAHDSYVSFFCGENTERVTLDLLIVLLDECGQLRQARIFPGQDLYYPNEKLVYVRTCVPVVRTTLFDRALVRRKKVSESRYCPFIIALCPSRVLVSEMQRVYELV
jgi:hypothetical protein